MTISIKYKNISLIIKKNKKYFNTKNLRYKKKVKKEIEN